VAVGFHRRRFESAHAKIEPARTQHHITGRFVLADRVLMPNLPLDYPEPFAATLGVMHYPGVDQESSSRARAYASQHLAEPVRRFHNAGHRLHYEALARIAMDSGEHLDNVERQFQAGLVMGDMLWIFFTLAHTHGSIATWNNTIRFAELAAPKFGVSGTRSALWDVKRRFQTVAHLWCAWSVRNGEFSADPEIEYAGLQEFLCFLIDAEYFRRWGQTWQASRSRSKPPLPEDVWQVSKDSLPRIDLPASLRRGRIPLRRLDENVLAGLAPAGRPKNAS
jgi:hypothetical protein